VTKILPFLLLACLPLTAFVNKKRTTDPRLHQVRTIFIKGNNQAAVTARENLSKWTCFILANNPTQAGATLDLAQQESVNGSIFSANRERSIITAELTAPDGSVLWNDSATRDAGFVNTGAGSAAHFILEHLQADAFPTATMGLRGVRASSCPAIGDTAPPLTATFTFDGTKEIHLGMTTEQVEHILGSPDIKADLGEKLLFKYKNLTVEFHAGKVTDVR
jgi:hypothetical protein